MTRGATQAGYRRRGGKSETADEGARLRQCAGVDGRKALDHRLPEAGAFVPSVWLVAPILRCSGRITAKYRGSMRCNLKHPLRIAGSWGQCATHHLYYTIGGYQLGTSSFSSNVMYPVRHQDSNTLQAIRSTSQRSQKWCL